MLKVPSPESHFFQANGLRHHYWRWSNPGRPTIILLHGIRSYGRTWQATARAETTEELEGLLQRALSSRGPHVIERGV